MPIRTQSASLPTLADLDPGRQLNPYALAALLFLSGCSGLIYEVVWARELVLHLGNTSMAHSIVIASFMTGLGLGYLALGQWAARAPRPLRVYAWLELGIAGCAALASAGLPAIGA